MFKRLQNLWELSQYRPKSKRKHEFVDVDGKAGTLEPVTELVLEKDTGDVKAEFIGAGTQEEFEQFQRDEKGFKGIFGIGK